MPSIPSSITRILDRLTNILGSSIAVRLSDNNVEDSGHGTSADGEPMVVLSETAHPSLAAGMPALTPDEDAGPDKDTGSDDNAFHDTAAEYTTPPDQTQPEDMSNGNSPCGEVSPKSLGAKNSRPSGFRKRDAQEAKDEEVEDEDNLEGLTKQSWEILDIVDHDVDPEEPTRIIFQCLWNLGTSESSMTWEPECVVQADAPLVWERYTARRNHRVVLSPNLQDQWHILGINSHQCTSNQRKTVVTLNVSWVGSTEDSDVTEAYVKNNSPLILEEYWDRLGGRMEALNLTNQG
ncbi:hypothetical protein EsH8_XIV_000006 [Colletotrichum jinshuiense]